MLATFVCKIKLSASYWFLDGIVAIAVVGSAEYEKHTHTQPFNGRLSGTTRVGRYQKKHSPAHTHPGQRTSFITVLHLQ